jgi:hypothetical protein
MTANGLHSTSKLILIQYLRCLVVWLLRSAQFVVSADPSTDEDAQTPYTWAIILGGTNDLVMGTRGNDIWESLKEVYKIPLQAGTKVLALTVPECGDCSATVGAQHNRLNTLIQSHKAIKMYSNILSRMEHPSLVQKLTYPARPLISAQPSRTGRCRKIEGR